MDRLIKTDLYRYQGLTGFKGFLKGLLIPGFRYTYLMRKVARHKKFSLSGLFYRFLKQRYTYKYGFQIPSSTQIGEGFYIGHFGSIVINGRVTIGNYCNIAHGVTLGQVNRGKMKGYPVIGNYVWIGTNAVIVGGVKIGNNVLIAPNTYLNTDVPDNSIVIGNPAKIIQKDNPVDGYIVYILE